ncbi:hypothetical protein MKQ70_32070 [Chitinophaga sedimenti]|uniref:hypothetical protein n=1 Tax=Chitinophaga sedimenti TaxID=2033606 RepID=UPI0020040CEF|nr:hypothetical protein [Chitinophaga sedimenti]MCK7559355.1 hypothetical protein [Chitinophaga sedimenti]
MQNVESVINNNTQVLKPKKEIKLNLNTPIFSSVVEKALPVKFINQSILAGNIEGSGSSLGMNMYDDLNLTQIFAINMSIMQIYEFAYPEIFDYPGKLLIIDVLDSSKYILPADPSRDWERQNTYTYELLTPVKGRDSALAVMRKDLERYFPVKIKKQIKEIKSWSLTTLDSNLSKAKAGEKKETICTFKTLQRRSIFETSHLSHWW